MSLEVMMAPLESLFVVGYDKLGVFFAQILLYYLYLFFFFFFCCTDLNECQDGRTNNCTQTCSRDVSNGTSSHECGCHIGYQLNEDGATCDGICRTQYTL